LSKLPENRRVQICSARNAVKHNCAVLTGCRGALLEEKTTRDSQATVRTCTNDTTNGAAHYPGLFGSTRQSILAWQLLISEPLIDPGLRGRLKVGLQVLALEIEVRALAPQPSSRMRDFLISAAAAFPYPAIFIIDIFFHLFAVFSFVPCKRVNQAHPAYAGVPAGGHRRKLLLRKSAEDFFLDLWPSFSEHARRHLLKIIRS
jgi:hypothetical protein